MAEHWERSKYHDGLWVREIALPAVEYTDGCTTVSIPGGGLDGTVKSKLAVSGVDAPRRGVFVGEKPPHWRHEIGAAWVQGLMADGRKCFV